MISALYFLSPKGDVLIARIYRDDVSVKAAETFRLQVLGAKDVRTPIQTNKVDDITFLHIFKNNVYIVAVTQQNANVAIVFELLHGIVALFKGYFGGSFNADAIRSNFVLVYELLDEIVDNGHPQITDFETLNLYITQKKNEKGKDGVVLNEAERLKQLTGAVTGQTPWRPPGAKYRKNEIFIDVIESVNLLVSAKGTILRADVDGTIRMKCFLSGMPECKFGMNDKVMMDQERQAGPGARKATGRRANAIAIDDCTFHQCVRLGKFDTERTITFIPPDGEFDLMKYRITENVNFPFRIIPIVKEIGRSRVEMQVTVKANFNLKMVGSLVIIKLPTPKNAAICKIHTTTGKARYQPSQNAIVWRIRKFPGDHEYSISANIDLSASMSKKAWSRPPISMQFTVPMYTASGLHVRFLKCVEPKLHYQTVKWVRYVTKAGQFQARI
eukprot:TRINITY_DN7125_c0_g1_i1.p1 TRINITY_DN7125_c0_g1~~TRINITY_DN7125_c0_g1_i1.p1  ORF type:complete len:443 (+),score=129.44 TRINITY_DN7125_c0_g1_i1:115-1443(+)